MGDVRYDEASNTVWAEVQMVPLIAVAQGVYPCNGFSVENPRGVFGVINTETGQFIIAGAIDM